jgi:hypothetical protein
MRLENWEGGSSFWHKGQVLLGVDALLDKTTCLPTGVDNISGRGLGRGL